MFKFDISKRGKQIAEGMNSIIYEYGDEEQGRRNYLVKHLVSVTEDKERQYTEEYMLGFNHNHPYILSYEGFCKKIVNPIRNISEIFIKMKSMKKDLQKYVKECEDKIPEADIITIFYSLAKALDFLKKNGIAHSNIVHQSVLFDEKGILKLAGFAFSKFKPWKNSEDRIYQSYYPPEGPSSKSKLNFDEQMTDEEKKRKIKETKELAFKSDVWCLGKLIVDVCLRRDHGAKGKDQSAPEILKDMEEDLAKVKELYGEVLTSILRSLLKEKPQDRLSFAKICDALEHRYEKMVLDAQFDKDDDNSSVSIDSIHSLPGEEEAQTEAPSEVQPASQNQSGSNSILNQGMIMFESSLALSIDTYRDLRDSASASTKTTSTSQLSDTYLPLLLHFYQSSELHHEIVRCFLSEISSETTSNASGQQNPSALLNALDEKLKALSKQVSETKSAQDDFLNLPELPDVNQSEPDQSSSLKKDNEKE